MLTVSDGDNIPKIVPGKLIAADAGQIVLRKNARENLSFDRSKVVAVLFFPPVDPDLAMKWVDCLGKSEKSDYEDDEGFKDKADFHESMLLNNGDRLYGRFLSARKGIIRFQLVDTNEVISIPLRRVRLWVAGTP
ncbi:MAG TPA: hypothetical protein DEB39_04110 [Planctomycetaceae bacterium]|nr:hypothetical protein [Planctomycetaceae bacterium]